MRGWFCETMLISLGGCAFFCVNDAFLSFFMSICHFHRAFFKHIRELLGKIKGEGQNWQMEAKVTLSEIIQFHNTAKG